jgi:DNA-binding MarR family transcriptional regulator
MDAYSSDQASSYMLTAPPVLIAGTSDAAISRAERAVGAAGLRIGARLPIDAAAERLSVQPKAAAVWVEIDTDCGGPMDELLTGIGQDVSDQRYVAVVSTTARLVDPVAAGLKNDAIQLIVDADDVERSAALALALAMTEMPLALSDVASDQNAERLRQLSEEVNRIASTLARLSAGPSTAPRAVEPAFTADIPPLSAETVRNVIRARRLRARYFSADMFADPAWDMLLDLLQAEIAQLRVPVSSLCIAAAVPATTALRWLKTMVSEGLFVRRADPHDGRRVFVELAPDASIALRRYFAEVGPVAVI